MTQIKIHGFAPSTYTRTARMAAIEVGADHDLVPLAFAQPEHFALHPFGKMPILTNGKDTVFETLAIVAYLDRKFGEGRLFPADALIQSLSTISSAIDYAYGPVVKIDKENDDDFAAAGKVFDWLESLLQRNPYLSGKAVGAADLFLAPMVAYHIAEVGPDHVWRDRPKLKAWFDSISKRDSFKKTAS